MLGSLTFASTRMPASCLKFPRLTPQVINRKSISLKKSSSFHRPLLSLSASGEAASATEPPHEGKKPLISEEQQPAILALFMQSARLFLRVILGVLMAPLNWMYKKLGFQTIHAREIIYRLESENALDSPDKIAEVLKFINKRSPEAVAEFIENRILKSSVDGPPLPESMAEIQLPVNAAVVREYVVALVKTGKLDAYGEDAQAGLIAAGQTHSSLPRLLEDLKGAAQGKSPTAGPGESVARPLHVYLQGAVAGKPAPGLFTTLRSIFWFAMICSAFSILWSLGAAIMRRGSGLPISQGVPTTSSTAMTTGAGNTMFAPKEYAKEDLPEKSVKSFADVKGCDEAVEELKEIVEYLRNPERFTKLGGRLPKGVLLTGPPGTGKTLLAKAVAGEAGVPFFFKAGSEFEEMLVGVGARRVRSLFAAAKKKAPCIVFIDEIDAVGGKRTGWDSKASGTRMTLNQLLTAMDGFEENSGVIVMAATNLPETLDVALTRPGRFDRQVAVPLPDVRGRQQILDLYLKDKPVALDVSIPNLARRTPGFSGAELFNLVNEGALLAARQGADNIDAAVLDEARDKILMGVPRALVQTEQARRLTAYHEGGHALVALYTPGAKPIHKATIIPRGHALGMVSQVPDGDEYSVTRQQLMANIDVCMGGKAAEELIFGEEFVTSGATSDLMQATKTARHMVEDCGMSHEIGPVALSKNGSEAEEIRQAVDREVGKMLKSAYDRVKRLLKDKQDDLHKIASALLERETLTLEELRDILGLPALKKFEDDPAGLVPAGSLAKTTPTGSN